MNKAVSFDGSPMDQNIYPALQQGNSVYYLLNGDTASPEGPNHSQVVQNMLSNSLCFTFPTGFTLCGTIQLNSFEYVLFFSSDSNSHIGLFNSDDCTYLEIVSAPCLNFSPDFPVRGVYKFNPSNGQREIYFIDNKNPNRYLNIDAAYPKKLAPLANPCVSCGTIYSEDLDCEKLNIFRNVKPTQIKLFSNEGGTLNSGVYQLAVAYGEDNMVLTDYFLGPIVKAYSESSNISLQATISCTGENLFSQMFVSLITNTRESSQVVYNLGKFSSDLSTLNIANLSNTTIQDITQVLTKYSDFDRSNHIATNGETLIIGQHTANEPLRYQSQANNIVPKWASVKVKASEAYKYPTWMKDEVYGLGIEWFSLKGKSKGVFHIPGRAPGTVQIFNKTTGVYDTVNETSTADESYWDELDANCNLIPAKIWQVMNTTQITQTFDVECSDCTTNDIRSSIALKGKFGYWESRDFKYPCTDEWGDLAGQPIRHHRMPSHDKVHNYGSLNTDTWSANPNECVNLLILVPENIEHPKLANGTYDPDISGFRILWSDRIGTGNKSILHKGLLFSSRVENIVQGTKTESILYPNYPFNDENPDVLLSKTQTVDDQGNYVGSPQENFTPANENSFIDQFYYSPDVQYRETRREIGAQITLYGEEIGTIDGNIHPTYLHPSIAIGRGGQPITKGLRTFAFQQNSVANLNSFYCSDSLLLNSFYNNFSILKSQYLLPIKQKVLLDSLGSNVKINNQDRDYCHYLRLNRNLIKQKIDVTRLLAQEIPFNLLEPDTSKTLYFDSNDMVTRDGTLKPIQAVVPFVAVKNKLPNQYGSLEDIKYIPCNSTVTIIPPSTSYAPDVTILHTGFGYFGGDTFISKHSFTRRFPLFTEWLYDVPYNTEYDYRMKRNVYYPRFWYDNLSTANDQFNLDSVVVTDPSPLVVKGKFYTSVNGVVSYYMESEFIADYRETSTDPNGSYYPKLESFDMFRSDIFKLPERFLYNIALLNGNVESNYQDLTPTTNQMDYMVSYSLKDDGQSESNKWLQFLASNYTILPKSYGKFTGMHYTDMYSILFFFENEVLYSQINFTLNTDQGNSILLNQGDIFSNRLVKLSNEETGYVGCVDPESVVNTRYGTFFIDRYRKKLFRWDGKLSEHAGNRNMMEPWFNSYFNNRYPDYSSSIISVFDNFTKRIYFTEKDPRTGLNWTFSFKPEDNSFSFHSFRPNFYLHAPNTYLSTNYLGIWKHNSLYSYQNYYGQQYPFDVGFFISNGMQVVEFQDLEVFSEWLQIKGYNQEVYNPNVFFDYLFAYNNNGSTGKIPLFLKNKSNPAESLLQNAEAPSYVAEVTRVMDTLFRINKLVNYRTPLSESLIMTNNGVDYLPLNTNINLSPLEREDIKGKWLKLHLISTNNSVNKILLCLVNSNLQEISR